MAEPDIPLLSLRTNEALGLDDFGATLQKEGLFLPLLIYSFAATRGVNEAYALLKDLRQNPQPYCGCLGWRPEVLSAATERLAQHIRERSVDRGWPSAPNHPPP